MNANALIEPLTSLAGDEELPERVRALLRAVLFRAVTRGDVGDSALRALYVAACDVRLGSADTAEVERAAGVVLRPERRSA